MTELGPGPRPDSRFAAALATLREEVTAGRFRDADMLPGERDLSDLLSVSRTTVRRVLAELVADGLLTQRQGVGTFVNRAPRPVQGPAYLAGFTEEMRLRGLEPSSRDIERGIFRPTPTETMMLACSPEADVIRLSRIRYADDLPMAVEHAVVPTVFLDDPSAIGASLYAALDQRGLRPVRRLQRIRAMIMEDGDAARLAVPPRGAALLILRTDFLNDGRCCAVTRSVYRSDRYDLVAERAAGA